MLALGYDDVDQFASFEPEDMERMRTALLQKEVPAGHVDKIVRAVKACRPLPEAVYPSAGTPLPAAGTPPLEPASVSHGASGGEGSGGEGSGREGGGREGSGREDRGREDRGRGDTTTTTATGA